MKKIYFVAALLMSTASFAQQVSFENFAIGSSESYWNGSDLSGTSDGFGSFTSITEEAPFEFKTVYDTSWGAAYGYWSNGWAFSNQTSDTLTSTNGQHSSYAGGAADGSQYAIGQQKSIISKTNATAHFESIKITNSNYAAHSMLNGDMFAKKFGGSSGDDPDWFLLSIVGYDSLDGRIDSVEFYLADYRFSDNSQDYVVKNWTTVDISSLNSAAYIEFKMTSSDVGSWGMNTPSFFAIDEVTYQSSAAVSENNNPNFNLYPNPATSELYINIENGVYSYEIISLEGKVLRKGTIVNSPLSISDIPSGNYLMRVIGENGVHTKPFIKF